MTFRELLGTLDHDLFAAGKAGLHRDLLARRRTGPDRPALHVIGSTAHTDLALRARAQGQA